MYVKGNLVVITDAYGLAESRIVQHCANLSLSMILRSYLTPSHGAACLTVLRLRRLTDGLSARNLNIIVEK